MILSLSATLAADISVSSNVDRTEIYENENVKLTIVIEGASDIPDLSLPELDGFQSYSAGTSQSMTWINGKMQSSKTFSFRLIPTRTGTLRVPPMTLKIEGESYSTEEFTIEVKSGTSPGSQASNRPQDSRATRQRQPRGLDSDDLFITTSVDKDTVYVNEQITLSFKFYQDPQVDVLQNPEFKPPQKTGFWVEDLPPRNSGYKMLNNRRYHVTEIKTALFPTTSGEPVIGPAELTLVVRDPRSRDPFSIFDRNFFGFSGRGTTVPLKSDPIKIVSLPLPIDGRPEDFSGAVGNYDIFVDADKTTVEANEPITLTVRISGMGNVETIAAPTIPELPDFRSYQSGDSEAISKRNYRIGGTKSFEYVFIPKRAGTYHLPAIRFSFFDPDAEEYREVSSQPIEVSVTPAEDRYASQMQNLEANQIDLVAKDIRYLKSDLGRINGGKSRLLALNPLLLALYLVPIIGYFMVSRHKQRQERLQSDRSYRRFKQARKMATKRLSQAEHFMKSDRLEEFYSELNRSVIAYFGDRFDLPTYGLTADSIREFARGRLSDELTERLLEILKTCDFGRFAPGGAEKEQMQNLLDEAKSLIVELEKTR